MLYRFPPGTEAIVVADYDRPYDDPIAVRAGELIVPDFSRTTDFLGWTWCKGQDGREGWVPDRWVDRRDGVWRILRDFSALELTVRTGDRVALAYSESGFVFGRTGAGDAGWVPDAVLELA